MTLRQEIEKLRDELIEIFSDIDIKDCRSHDLGLHTAYKACSIRLSNILSCHTGEQQSNGTIADGNQSTAPSQRERIATAIMLELIRSNKTPAFMQAVPSVTAADALIAELNKPTK